MPGWRLALEVGLLMGLSACAQAPDALSVSRVGGDLAEHQPDSSSRQLQQEAINFSGWNRWIYSDRQSKLILQRINAERASRGLKALVREPRLDTAARRLSIEMAVKSFYGHTGANGMKGDDRIRAAGATFKSWGEIIGLLETTDAAAAERMVTRWMSSSEGQKEAILSNSFKRVGIGVDASNNKVYYTVVFAD